MLGASRQRGSGKVRFPEGNGREEVVYGEAVIVFPRQAGGGLAVRKPCPPRDLVLAMCHFTPGAPSSPAGRWTNRLIAMVTELIFLLDSSRYPDTFSDC